METLTRREVVERCDGGNELAAEARAGAEDLLQGLDGAWHQVAVVIDQGPGQPHTVHSWGSLQGRGTAHKEKRIKTNHRKFYRAGVKVYVTQTLCLPTSPIGFAVSTFVFPLSPNQSALSLSLHVKDTLRQK